MEFVGRALPLESAQLSEILEKLKTGPAELWAVLDVETHGCGFLPDRRPLILFERHVFSRKTSRKYDAQHPDISHEDMGGWGKGGAHQYKRLHKAIELDREAALFSTSWGIGQLMGFNAEMAGYTDVETMVADMLDSEYNQLAGMVGEIEKAKLDRALRDHDWAGFARGYNGKKYYVHQYDVRLAAAYEKYSRKLPDLTVRKAQIFLTYLEYDPRTIDGLWGKYTESALHEFQDANGLPRTDEIGEEEIAALTEKVNEI